MKQLYTLLLALFVCGTTYAQQYEFSNNGSRVVEDNNNAKGDGVEWFMLQHQGTYIYQWKPAFNSPYHGTNSMSGQEEFENSITATMFAGVRLWKGAEAYVNPEIAGGSGLSSALGMGGSANGETFRVGSPGVTVYLARAYLKQTFALRNKRARKLGYVNSVQLESDENQLAGYEPKDYIRFYVGKLSLADLFDNNEYSNSPRTQFINWALMNNGAWDYAANTRGYTANFTTELQLGKMNYKASVSALPTTANGSKLNEDITESFALNGEITRTISIRKRPGHIRLLGYYNTTTLGNYAEAVRMASITNIKPDIDAVHWPGRTKYGFGLNMDQQLSNTFGAFMRIGWNDGKNETWCFTEIDQTLALGLSANGHKWKRAGDNTGLAIVINGLSKDHQLYLSRGGLGFILGDGRLNYAPEFIAEYFYSFKPLKKKDIWLSGDYQFCVNPGYNADRGPVSIFSIRVHAEI